MYDRHYKHERDDMRAMLVTHHANAIELGRMQIKVQNTRFSDDAYEKQAKKCKESFAAILETLGLNQE